MPMQQITFQPGVNTELTPILNTGAISQSQLIRFSPSGLPQKIGGWTRFWQYAIGSIVRALHAWEDLSSILHLGVGAVDSLSVITDNNIQVITPQLYVSNPAVNFSTTNGSSTVEIVDPSNDATIYDVVIIQTQVSVGGLVLFGAYPVALTLDGNTYDITAASDATSTVSNGGAVPTFTTTSGNSSITVVLDNHGLSVGGTFPVAVPVTVGGLTLSDFYTVNSVIDANTFTINAANQASASATVSMNGGNAQIDYYITPGPANVAVGYGVGEYGIGGYGTGQIIPSRAGSTITVTDYTLDNWGGYLAASPNNGPIFIWQPNSGLFAAQMIAQAPIANTGMFVAMPAQIMVAYGSSVLGIQDPLLINWSDVGNYTKWTALTTNQAGSYRLSKGSRIVGGMQGPQYGLIWTDIDVWSMSYIGQPFVFGFTELASGCGMISKFGATVLGTTIFWISQKGFFALPAGGSVTPVPCTVWDFIFQNLNTTYQTNIRAASNSQFGEVAWYFPSLSSTSGENDCYVKFTPALSAWDYGLLGRSAWIDQSVFGPPIGADPVTQLVYQHETSMDADGAAINASFTTGYWALAEGEQQAFVDLTIPDMRWGFLDQSQGASVQIEFNYSDYPTGSPNYTCGPYTMTSNGPSFLNTRFRGRFESMTISSSDTGSFWRLGGLRTRVAPDGRL